MSTFLERLRARNRRTIARRNRREPGASRTPGLDVLALDASQTEAIRNALDSDLAQDDVGQGEQGGEPQGAELGDEELERLTTPAAPVVNTASFGNPPGDFDLGAIDGDVTPEAPAVETIVLERLEFTKSSNLVSAELGAGGVVAVTFKDGKIYRYGNFTPALMADWKAAKSAGSWFHTNVRTKQDRHPVVAAAAD